MSIRYKLGFAFAAVLLLAGGLALYGMQTISRTGDAVIRLYDEPLVAVNRARAADANFDKARVTMGRAMAFLDRVPEDELHRLDALVRDVLEDLKIVRDRVNDQRVVDALDTAQFLIRDWHETGLKILRPAPGGLTEVPLAVTVARKADRAAAALDDVVELGAARGFEFRSMSDAAVAASRLRMMVLAMATAVVGVALSLAFAHSISRPIRAATAIAERVARGNFSDAIVSKRRDELGRLLRSLAQMQASLRAKAEAERLASQAKDRAHTEQVTKTEGELRRTRTFLDTVVENIPAMLFVKDARDHRFVLLNRAGEELLGVSREAVIGKNDYDFFPKEEADYFVSRDREVLQSGRLQIIEQEPIHTPHNGLAPAADQEDRHLRRQRRPAISVGRLRGHHRSKASGSADRTHGASRRVDRSAQPDELHRSACLHARSSGHDGGPFCRALRRPRSFQGSQRRIRPLRRGRSPARNVSTAANGRRRRLPGPHRR